MTQYCAGPPNLDVGDVIEDAALTADADEAWDLADRSNQGCCHRGGGVYEVERIDEQHAQVLRVLNTAVPRGRNEARVAI